MTKLNSSGKYTDVTPKKLKTLYPTKDWTHRFYQAVRR